MKTYRYIWSLFTYAPGLYLADLALTSIVFSTPVLSGLIIREFLDRLSGHGQTGFGLWTLIALLLAVAAGRWIPILLVGWAESTHNHRMQGLLRHNLLRAILKQPGAAPLRAAPGEVLGRFRDDVEDANRIFMVLYDLIGHTIQVGAAVAVMLTVNAQLTLLIFAPLLVVMLVADRTRKAVEACRRQVREATGQATGTLGELLGAAQALTLAGAEDRAVDHYTALNDTRRRLALKDTLLMQVLDFLFGNTTTFGTAMLFLVAARQVGTPAFTVGDFALFTYYLQYMWEFVSDVGEFVPKYKQVGVAFDRLLELTHDASPGALVEHRSIFDPGPAPAPEAPATAPLQRLEVRGLTCLHPETGRGVANIDLTLERGSFTVITGRVGSGKSTLLRAILGLLPATAGEIRWNGRPVTDPATFFTAPRCAYTSQSPVLLSGTLADNICLGYPATPDALQEALHAAVLEADVARMEHGLHTQVGARGVKLSGGQIQRTAAARMFIRQADLLVFDDLSSALDSETEQILWERLSQRDGVTCLAVSHRPEVLRRADRVIVLDEGRIVS